MSTSAIVGASLAGAKAAQTLRGEGFDGRVVLIGEEPGRPYERPPTGDLIRSGVVADVSGLTDPDVALEELVPR